MEGQVKYIEHVSMYDLCLRIDTHKYGIYILPRCLETFKVWSASGRFLVVLSTRRIKDTPVVWHVLTSEYFSSASPPLEVDRYHDEINVA